MEKATAEQSKSGDWQVTLEVTARKVVFDSAGVEADVPMDEWVPISVLGPPGAATWATRSTSRCTAFALGGRPSRSRCRSSRSWPALTYHLLDWAEDEDDGNIEGVNAGSS